MPQRATRARLAASLVLAAVLLASCGGTIVTIGTIEGVAPTCGSRYATPVVTVLEDAAAVASLHVGSDGRFSIRLSPGHYIVTTGSQAVRVLLTAGGTKHVTLAAPACPKVN